MSTVVIVGHGPNLGAAVARRFAREGWRVVLVARDAARLERESAALRKRGHDVLGRACDVLDAQALDQTLAEIAESPGGVQLLNYNAASIRHATLCEQSLQSIAADLMTNVGGAMVAARALIPSMHRRGSGTLLFSGGQLALEPWPDYLSLGVGKAALRNLAQSLANDPACAKLRIANIVIDAHITAPVAEDLADLYWRLQQRPRSDWSVDVRYSAPH